MSRSAKVTGRTSSGVSLVELLMALTISLIIGTVLVTLLMMITGGFTGYEASAALHKTNQKSLNRIYLKLGSCKRIFQNITNDTGYLNRLSMISAPPRLTGSKLPLIQPNGNLNVGTTDFVSADVGNMLFFASNETMQSVTTSSIRIDIYAFNCYYLTSDNPKSLPRVATYRLVEWNSVQYADYIQLMAISDATTRSNVVKGLVSLGVVFSWDPTAVAGTSGFYTLSSVGSITADPYHQIPMRRSTILTEMMTGILIGGYRYGISPNTSVWSATPKTVPVYGTAASAFPSGFEVAIIGPSAGRSVLIRSVLVAKGSMKSTLGDECQLVCSARDLW